MMKEICRCSHKREQHNKRQKNSGWIGCDVCNCKCYEKKEPILYV